MILSTIHVIGQNISLDYLSYLGGSGEDMVNKITTDKDGYIYIYGSTTSKEILSDKGGKVSKIGDCSGIVNSFIIKLTPQLDSVLFLTLLGGDNFDIPYGGIIVDENGIFLTGQTNSSNFPTSENAFRKSYCGGYDAFFVKLNLSGDSIEYSTYIGGSKDDQYPQLSLTKNQVIVSMVTSSDNYPVLQNCLKDTLGGSDDISISIFNRNTYELEYSTYFGGNAHEKCRFSELRGEKLYLTGVTSSFDFPTTSKAIKKELTEEDMFFSVFDIKSKQIEYSTLLGTEYGDEGKNVMVDSNSIIICGTTTSKKDLAKNRDCYYVELNSEYEFVSSHTFGSNGYDSFNVIGRTNDGKLIFVGLTQSHDFPVSKNAIDSTFGGKKESVLLLFNSVENKIEYATFVGGDGSDFIQSSKLLENETLILAGGTTSSDIQTTDINLQNSFKGAVDILLVRYKMKN